MQRYGVITGMTGEYAGRRMELAAGETVWFGSDPMNATVLQGDSVSRFHCGVSYDEDQQCFWVLNDSEFGVFTAQGTCLPRGKETCMRPGELFRIGNYQFALAEREERQADAEPSRTDGQPGGAAANTSQGGGRKKIALAAALILVCLVAGGVWALGNRGDSGAPSETEYSAVGEDDVASAGTEYSADTEGSDSTDAASDEVEEEGPPGTPLEFEDSEMKKCVLAQTGYSEIYEPTDELCASITELDTTGYALATLSDLEYMPNLEVLTVNNSANEEALSLKGINKAAKLKKLTLRNCRLYEVDRIAELTELEYLDISTDSKTYVTDYSTLSALKNLKYLDMSWNGYNVYNSFRLADGSFLNELTALEELNIYETGIENYSLSKLSNLKRLSVSECKMDDVLQQLDESGALPQLEYLYALYEGTLTDEGMVTYLAKAVSLEELWISMESLTTLQGFSNLQNLKILHVNNSTAFDIPISEWDEIGTLTNLEMLTLDGNANSKSVLDGTDQPDDYAFLDTLENMKYLCIGAYTGMSVSCLKDLDNLEVLNLDGYTSYPYTVDLTGIGELDSLREFNYRGVTFKSTAPLDDLDDLSVSNVGLGVDLYFYQ